MNSEGKLGGGAVAVAVGDQVSLSLKDSDPSWVGLCFSAPAELDDFGTRDSIFQSVSYFAVVN